MLFSHSTADDEDDNANADDELSFSFFSIFLSILYIYRYFVLFEIESDVFIWEGTQTVL